MEQLDIGPPPTARQRKAAAVLPLGQLIELQLLQAQALLSSRGKRTRVIVPGKQDSAAKDNLQRTGVEGKPQQHHCQAHPPSRSQREAFLQLGARQRAMEASATQAVAAAAAAAAAAGNGRAPPLVIRRPRRRFGGSSMGALYRAPLSQAALPPDYAEHFQGLSNFHAPALPPMPSRAPPPNHPDVVMEEATAAAATATAAAEVQVEPAGGLDSMPVVAAAAPSASPQQPPAPAPAPAEPLLQLPAFARLPLQPEPLKLQPKPAAAAAASAGGLLLSSMLLDGIGGGGAVGSSPAVAGAEAAAEDEEEDEDEEDDEEDGDDDPGSGAAGLLPLGEAVGMGMDMDMAAGAGAEGEGADSVAVAAGGDWEVEEEVF